MKLVKFKDYMDIIKGLIKKKVYNSLPATLNTGDMVLYKGALYQYFGENNTVVNLITEDNFILADLEHKVRIGKWVLADRIEYDEIYQRGLQLQDENYMYGKFVNTIRFDYGISSEGEIGSIRRTGNYGGRVFNKEKRFIGYKHYFYVNENETKFYTYLRFSVESNNEYGNDLPIEPTIKKYHTYHKTMFTNYLPMLYYEKEYWAGNGWNKGSITREGVLLEKINDINNKVIDPKYDFIKWGRNKPKIKSRVVSYINKISLPKNIFKISSNIFCDVFFSNKNYVLLHSPQDKLIQIDGRATPDDKSESYTDSNGDTQHRTIYYVDYNIKNATFKIFTDEREENYAIEQPSYKWRLNLYSHKLINQVGNNGYNDLNYGANEYGFAFVFNFKYDGLYRVTLQANITSKGQVWTGLEVHFGKDIVNDTDRLSYVRMAHREDLKLIFEVKKGKVISISLDTQAEYTGEAKKLIDNIVKTLYHYDIPGFGHLLSCTYVPHRIDDIGSWDELQIATLTAPLTVEKLI